MEITMMTSQPQRARASVVDPFVGIGQLVSPVVGRVQGCSVPAFGPYSFGGAVVAAAAGTDAVAAMPQKFAIVPGVNGSRRRSGPV